MIRTWGYITVNIIVFVLLQVLVMNNIHLFGVVVPFIYIYIILKFPVDITRSRMVLLSFFIGLLIDIFSNTFGMHAAACTLAGFVRTPLLERFVDVREMPADSIPTYRLFGLGRFLRYTVFLVSIHHVALFLIESFTLFQPVMMITRMLSGILLTMMLIFILEAFNLSKSKSGE
jgi:rod shape-determining protein MreD